MEPHLAEGLEFRAVVVAACDDEVIPLQSRIEAVADTADLEDVYNTERHLLYVACTRARDHLAGRHADPVAPRSVPSRRRVGWYRAVGAEACRDITVPRD